ncbi:hypothetical protein [Listeria booriae]|uniref:Uncharacterized protein n=1 Tax=Listeria booriae TaxID=1552123 RepID=A0A7X0YK02_9LIST|nr:hypothetical protein [Listeria booriae]MBC1290597.1 hypothetical protein [Listeria booriae]MBC2115715.1 hypothetical protein [Listeria booriae]
MVNAIDAARIANQERGILSDIKADGGLNTRIVLLSIEGQAYITKQIRLMMMKSFICLIKTAKF